MSVSSPFEAAASTSVGMGQVTFARGPARLSAVLGSCVGVALFHPRARLGALAHVVLPRALKTAGAPCKFADAAIPHMIEQMERQGAGRGGLIAKIAGGACMFGTRGPMQIGEQNVVAVVAALDAARVRLLGQETGGTCGRRIMLDCADGALRVETIGRPPKIF